MATAAGSAISGCPSVRIIIQQCLSARLQVQPPTENEDHAAQWVEVSVDVHNILSHLVSYAMLTRPNKAETAVHGC